MKKIELRSLVPTRYLTPEESALREEVRENMPEILSQAAQMKKELANQRKRQRKNSLRRPLFKAS